MAANAWEMTSASAAGVVDEEGNIFSARACTASLHPKGPWIQRVFNGQDIVIIDLARSVTQIM